MARTLTAANSVFMIIIPSLFPAPQQLQGFATDDVFSTDPIQPVETAMGVDGILSAGWVPVAKVTSITLQADSMSNDIFDALAAAQQALREVYQIEGSLTIPSIGRTYVMTRGFLSTWPPIPDARKILQPRKYGITWQDVLAAPI